jgi:hypothetical protein
MWQGGLIIGATIKEVLLAASTITAVLTPVVRRFGLTVPGFNVLHIRAHAEVRCCPGTSAASR